MDDVAGKTEKCVWERIRGLAAPPSVQVLAAAEMASAAVYLRLARMAQGPEKGLLRQLYAGERCHGRILAGIHRLTNGKQLSIRTPEPTGDGMGLALRKCYATGLKAASEYEARSQDPEYGHAFALLAAQERQQCAIILELLGILG